MMDDKTSDLVSHSIDDDSITRLEESVRPRFPDEPLVNTFPPSSSWMNSALLPSFITLTADHRYLIFVGVYYNSHYNDRICVMDVLNGKYELQECDIMIDREGRAPDEFSYGVSCKWIDEEIGVIVGGYIREMYVSECQNGHMVPEVVYNVIADYLDHPELLHCTMWLEEHFAISIDDILLALRTPQ